MSLRLGDIVPNFTAQTTEGEINFHDFLGEGWGVLFSHPADYTPVCTTELGRTALLKQEFERGLGGFNEFIDQVKGIEELKKLSETRKVHHYKKKDFIYMTGDEPKGVFLITSGKVKTYKAHPEGKQLITGMYNEGDFIGYTDVLQESEIQETAEAMVDCELVVIPKK